MKKVPNDYTGMGLLIEKYRAIFKSPENTNHYSEEDYKAAERKFLIWCLENRNTAPVGSPGEPPLL